MFWFVQIRFIQRKKFKTNILQGYSSLSNIFFLRRTHSKIVILTLLRALKVDMLTIQKLYGLNITPMSKAIWEYKNELPSLHELARSLSEKGTDFHRILSPELPVRNGAPEVATGNVNLIKNSLSWTKLIFTISFAIQQHHMFSFNVNYNQSTVDFSGPFDEHFLVAA